MPEDVKIECPKCGWEPDGGAYWSCTCGHIWNTFATAARCPACHKQWKDTQCIGFRGGCNQFSPHLDWYKGLDGWLEDELEAVSHSQEQLFAHEVGNVVEHRALPPELVAFHLAAAQDVLP